MFWLLKSYYDQLQRSLKQNKLNLHQIQLLPFRRNLEFIPMLNKQISGIVLWSRNTTVPHLNFWKKLFYLTFSNFRKNSQNFFFQTITEKKFNPYNNLRIGLHMTFFRTLLLCLLLSDLLLIFLPFWLPILFSKSMCNLIFQLPHFYKISMHSCWNFIGLFQLNTVFLKK